MARFRTPGTYGPYDLYRPAHARQEGAAMIFLALGSLATLYIGVFVLVDWRDTVEQ